MAWLSAQGVGILSLESGTDTIDYNGNETKKLKTNSFKPFKF